MSAVLRVVGGSKPSRQCDAKCHDAEKPECACICGGKNHGVGYDQAVINVRDGGVIIPESVHEMLCVSSAWIEIVPVYVQKSLF